MFVQMPASSLAGLLSDAADTRRCAASPSPQPFRALRLDLSGHRRDIAHLPEQTEKTQDPMSIPGQTFNDRLQAQKEAKLAMLKRAQEKQLDPAEKERLMEERAARNAAREEREQKRAAEKAAKIEQEKAEKAERERKKKLADEARKKAREELARQQKAARDAKYAARKARKKR
ncbi:MAG: DUF6481 family protein [Pseudomonadota bacterium]